MSTRTKSLLVAAVVLLIVVSGATGWLLRGNGDITNAAAKSDVPVGVPTIVSQGELSEMARHHYPFYAAGNRPGTKMEVTVTKKSAVFVRYLPDDVDAGDKGEYLTVSTYQAIDGYDALKGADKDAADVTESKNGAIIAVFKERPLSTYFSFKNAGFQVEVFSPKSGESKKLTDGGDIKLVGGGS
ncbi:hypothetical protein LY13_005005 [Prauserella aidingensis]|uniref:hypothetical protein n=1 Tax=Prauserella aidingensis TaxID=387890 RepID=UPI0020A2A778|nr:hypothetical protein [Prauserella aidingensis]MCP2256218.1 hypothetical protein [Prauserella aidingensis]